MVVFLKYRAEIDGLRSVAVLPVILFHAGFSVFSGGFVGVDVFFVISGFLITSILINELENGRFSYASFLERRARRILPALYFVILVSIPAAYILLLPNQLVDFGQSIMATVLFGSNILFWREVGYFAPAAELKPLLHTWSLAVEEQYYLLFPPCLWLLWHFGRRTAFWCALGVALMSLALSEWGWRNSPAGNFFLLPTRAWELLAGSLCAFLSVGQAQRSNNLLSLAGLGLILFAIFGFDGDLPFPSIYTLVPVGGTCLIIMYAGQGTLVRRVLSATPFVAIGLISYSAYLWHQPLFAFARLGVLTEPSPLVMGGLALAALLLAWISWAYIEAPFRNRTTGPLVTARSVFVTTGSFGILLFLAGFAGYGLQGMPQRPVGETSIGALNARIAPNFGFAQTCHARSAVPTECQTGPEPTVVLWGDSFAMHLASGLVASAGDRDIVQRTKNSCGPYHELAQIDAAGAQAWAEDCIGFNRDVLSWLGTQHQVDLVVLSSKFHALNSPQLLNGRGEILTGDPTDRLRAALVRTVQEIQALGIPVVVMGPSPKQHWDIGQCLVRREVYGRPEDACDFVLSKTITPQREAFLEAVAQEVPFYWLQRDICPDDLCDTYREGRILYQDSGHLTVEGSTFLGVKHGWITQLEGLAR